MRLADGDQDGAVRGVPRLHAVPEVQAYAAGAAGHQVPEVRHRRSGGAAHPQRAQLLRVPALSRLRLFGVEQAGGDRMPELSIRGHGSEAYQGRRGRDHAQVPQVRVRDAGHGGRSGGARGLTTQVTVVGGGLAGSEAAWALAERGIRVRLREMRPVKTTPAHHTDRLAELVCSNSFKSVGLTNAHGLLKAEMRRLGSVVLQAADEARVPGGAALAVDRDVFAAGVHRRVAQHHNVTIVRGEATALPAPGIVATGPLTSEALSVAIAARRRCGAWWASRRACASRSSSGCSEGSPGSPAPSSCATGASTATPTSTRRRRSPHTCQPETIRRCCLRGN